MKVSASGKVLQANCNRSFSISVPFEEFYCDVCRDGFATRIERNDHLLTHFVQRKCGICTKLVFIIGDLIFELHESWGCRSQSILSWGAVETKVEHEHEERIQVIQIPSICPETKATETFKIQEARIPPLSSKVPPKKAKKPARTVRTHEEAMRVKPEIKRRRSKKLIPSDVPRSRANTRNQTSIQKKQRASSFERLIPSSEEFSATINWPSMPFSDVSSEEDHFSLPVEKKQVTLPRNMPKSIQCDLCDEMFWTKKTMTHHTRVAHEWRPSTECDICKKIYSTLGNMMEHKRKVHEGHRRFRCDYCGKGYNSEYHLKEHINEHTGIKPYSCDICKKAISKFCNIRPHMRVSVGETKFLRLGNHNLRFYFHSLETHWRETVQM